MIGTEAAAASPCHPGTVYLITSWNPLGQPLAEEENDARQREFETQLSDQEWVPAVGVAEDGTWIEAGAGLTGVTREIALSIARRWDQEAIYEWDPAGSVMAVVSCVDDRIIARSATETELTLRPCPMRPPGEHSTEVCSFGAGDEEFDGRRRLMLRFLGCDVCAGSAHDAYLRSPARAK